MDHHTEQNEISLYFHDQTVAEAFGELLNSLGFQTRSLSSLAELASAGRVITEPLYYDSLSEDQKEHCLLVGNQFTSRTLKCPVIRQPLTPTKIQAGLQAFLGASMTQ